VNDLTGGDLYDDREKKLNRWKDGRRDHGGEETRREHRSALEGAPVTYPGAQTSTYVIHPSERPRRARRREPTWGEYGDSETAGDTAEDRAEEEEESLGSDDTGRRSKEQRRYANVVQNQSQAKSSRITPTKVEANPLQEGREDPEESFLRTTARQAGIDFRRGEGHTPGKGGQYRRQNTTTPMQPPLNRSRGESARKRNQETSREEWIRDCR
jgi:hypothetical protein